MAQLSKVTPSDQLQNERSSLTPPTTPTIPSPKKSMAKKMKDKAKKVKASITNLTDGHDHNMHRKSHDDDDKEEAQDDDENEEEEEQQHQHTSPVGSSEKIKEDSKVPMTSPVEYLSSAGLDPRPATDHGVPSHEQSAKRQQKLPATPDQETDLISPVMATSVANPDDHEAERSTGIRATSVDPEKKVQTKDDSVGDDAIPTSIHADVQTETQDSDVLIPDNKKNASFSVVDTDTDKLGPDVGAAAESKKTGKNNSFTDKLSPIYNRVSITKNVIASRLGYGGQEAIQEEKTKNITGEKGEGNANQLHHDVANGQQSKGYTDKIYDTAASVKNVISSKLGYGEQEARPKTQSEEKEDDKLKSNVGVAERKANVKPSVADKFSPGEEHKALSEIITNALSGTAKSAQESITRVSRGSENNAKNSEGSPKGKGIVERMSGLVGSLVGKKQDDQQPPPPKQSENFEREAKFESQKPEELPIPPVN
eukprot:Gb_39330 [translate_table: standard]